MIRYSFVRKVINKIRYENDDEILFYEIDSYKYFILLSVIASRNNEK